MVSLECTFPLDSIFKLHQLIRNFHFKLPIWKPVRGSGLCLQMKCLTRRGPPPLAGGRDHKSRLHPRPSGRPEQALSAQLAPRAFGLHARGYGRSVGGLVQSSQQRHLQQPVRDTIMISLADSTSSALPALLSIVLSTNLQ